MIAVDGMASAMETSGSISSTAVVTEAVVIVVTTALVDIADMMAAATTAATVAIAVPTYVTATGSWYRIIRLLQLLGPVS